MASIALSLHRTSMDGEVRLKLGFSTLQIFFYVATSLCCSATVAIIERNVKLAVEFAILAHLTNLLQLSLWEPNPKLLHKDSTVLVTVASTSENCKIKIASSSSSLQQSILLGFVSLVPYLSTAFIIRKNILVSFAILLIGFRSSLALGSLWLSPDELKSRWFNILSDITGLTLSEEIKPLLESVLSLNETEEKDQVDVMDDETESMKEKALIFLDQKNSKKGETRSDDQLLEEDDQDWEELDSCSIYEEALQMEGVEK